MQRQLVADIGREWRAAQVWLFFGGVCLLDSTAFVLLYPDDDVTSMLIAVVRPVRQDATLVLRLAGDSREGIIRRMRIALANPVCAFTHATLR